MTIISLFVVAIAAVAVLVYVARARSSARIPPTDAPPPRGQGLFDEMATAIEDVVDPILSSDSRRPR